MQSQVNIQNDEEITKILKFLQENNLDLNKVSQNSNTFLISAIQHNCFNACQFLIQQNQVLNYKNNDGFSPIIQAANNGRHDICNLLLEKDGSNILQDDISYAMIFAIKNKHLQIFQYLRSKNGNINIQYDNHPNNTLFAAYFSGDNDIFKYIVNDVDIDLTLRNKQGETILMIAAIENNINIVNILLKKNLDLNLQDNKGRSVLIHACQLQNFAICDLLLQQQNININIQNSHGNTALFYACKSKNVQIFNLFLHHKKIDISIQNSKKQHILYYCLQYQQFDFFKSLVKTHKIKLNDFFWCYDDHHQSIFYYLVKYANQDLIQFFLQCLNKYNKNSIINNLTYLFLDQLKLGNIDFCIQLLNRFSLQFNQLQINHSEKIYFVTNYKYNIEKSVVKLHRDQKKNFLDGINQQTLKNEITSSTTSPSNIQNLQTQNTQQTENIPSKKLKTNTITDQQILNFNLSDNEVNFLGNTSRQNFDQIIDYLSNTQSFQYSISPLKFQVIKSNIPITNKSTYLDILVNNQHYNIKEYTYYIQQVLQIPFDKYVDDVVRYQSNDKQQIQEFIEGFVKQLDEEIYGQHNAKNLLLELICKRITSNSQQGRIIGFQGPPGCGKTSLIKNGLAKTLNRPVEFIPMAQVSDSSFLTGSNRQWRGCHFGKILQTLIKHQCMNPIFVFDEIDKISNTTQGLNVQNVLSSILDFSQNNQFQDQYFDDLQVDLSKSIFIVTYNNKSLISPILLNRINSIHIDGYNLSEKIIITSQYVIPKIIKDYNFEVDYISLNNDVIKHLINNYTEQEPGIRKIEDSIDKIFSKLNIERFTSQSGTIFQFSFQENHFCCNITVQNIDKIFKDYKNNKSNQILSYFI